MKLTFSSGPTGVVPILLKIEVAVKPTPRGFSGRLAGETAMKNTARKKKLKEVEPVVQLTLADVIRADLHEFVIVAGTAAIGAVLEHERTLLVGPRYAHLAGREAPRGIRAWCAGARRAPCAGPASARSLDRWPRGRATELAFVRC